MAVFISYAHKDQQHLERLLVHLRPIMRGEDAIDVWSDKRLSTSDKWRKEISEAIDSCQIAILVISANFYASDFIISDELAPIISREAAGNCKIFCLLVGPSPFTNDEYLSQYQAIPDPSRTLAEHATSKRDRILQDFCGEIRQTLKVRISGGTISDKNSKQIRKTNPKSPTIYTKDSYKNETIEFYSLFKSQKENINLYGKQDISAVFGKTFDGCEIEGPGFLIPLDGCSFQNCEYDIDDYDLDVMFIPISANGVTGGMPISKCTFKDCTFVRIAFVGSQEMIDEMKREIADK